MPRLSSSDYYKRYKYLNYVWREQQGVFGELTPRDQWDLHAFYELSKSKSKEECVAYRQQMRKERPGLGQTAARAFLRFEVAYERYKNPKPVRKSTKRGPVTGVTVKALVRPKIDWEKLARVYLDAARRKLEKQTGKKITTVEEERRTYAELLLAQARAEGKRLPPKRKDQEQEDTKP